MIRPQIQVMIFFLGKFNLKDIVPLHNYLKLPKTLKPEGGPGHPHRVVAEAVVTDLL